MKYLFAVLLAVILGGFVLVAKNAVLTSNLMSGGSVPVKSYKSSSGDGFTVSPHGEFEFTQPVLITCSSKNPFSITGIASNSGNRIDLVEVYGRYSVLGSSKVTCVFATEDYLPVAYAVLPTPFMQLINTLFYAFGIVCFLVIGVYVIFWKIL